MKSKQEVHYDQITYVSVDGAICNITPGGVYKVKKEKGFYSSIISCGEKYGADDVRLIDHAMRLIATKPQFVLPSSLEWTLAYIKHAESLLSDVLVNDFGPEKIPELLMNSIKEKRNPVYITRLCSAVYLLNKVVNGGYINGLGDTHRIDEIVEERRSRWDNPTFAHKINMASNYLDSGGFKSAMTRSYFKGGMLKFTPPPGKIFLIKTENKTYELPHGKEILMRIDGFPFGRYSDSYFDSDYKNYGAPANGKSVEIPAEHPIFEGALYDPDQKLDGMVFNSFMFVKFYVPHDWVYAICDYGDTGLVDISVKNHKYDPADESCLNVEIHLPTITGQYSDDIRTAAKCFAFKDQGIGLPYPEKSIKAKDLLAFIKSPKPTSKSLKVRETVDRVIKSSCIYVISDTTSWGAINRLNPAEKVLVFRSEDEAVVKTIVVTWNKKTRGDIFIADNDVGTYLMEIDSSAKTFVHDSKRFNTLLDLLNFSYTSSGQAHVFEVVRQELFSSDAYTQYFNSKERMDDVLNQMHESSGDWMRTYL